MRLISSCTDIKQEPYSRLTYTGNRDIFHLAEVFFKTYASRIYKLRASLHIRLYILRRYTTHNHAVCYSSSFIKSLIGEIMLWINIKRQDVDIVIVLLYLNFVCITTVQNGMYAYINYVSITTLFIPPGACIHYSANRDIYSSLSQMIYLQCSILEITNTDCDNLINVSTLCSDKIWYCCEWLHFPL